MANSKQPYQTAITANGSQIRSEVRLNGNVNSLTSVAVKARGRWRRVLTVSLLLLRGYCVSSSEGFGFDPRQLPSDKTSPCDKDRKDQPKTLRWRNLTVCPTFCRSSLCFYITKCFITCQIVEEPQWLFSPLPPAIDIAPASLP